MQTHLPDKIKTLHPEWKEGLVKNTHLGVVEQVHEAMRVVPGAFVEGRLPVRGNRGGARYGSHPKSTIA